MCKLVICIKKIISCKTCKRSSNVEYYSGKNQNIRYHLRFAKYGVSIWEFKGKTSLWWKLLSVYRSQLIFFFLKKKDLKAYIGSFVSETLTRLKLEKNGYYVKLYTTIKILRLHSLYKFSIYFMQFFLYVILLLIYLIHLGSIV